MFSKIYIIGLGLLGSSLSLAIKEKKLAKVIIGISRRQKTIDYAIKNNIIDKGQLDFKNIQDPDFIILATPVFTIINHIKEISKLKLNKDIIITDIGSTKEEIMKTADNFLDCFVGSHPMAGKEKSGIYFADKDLFKNNICFIIKTEKTKNDKFLKVYKFWQELGANVIDISADKHDKITAEISHLPHIIAVNLINTLNTNNFIYSGQGLKDTTRIASSDSDMWKDIFLTNKINILESINLFQDKLENFKEKLENNKINEIIEFLKQAKEKRDEMVMGDKGTRDK